MAGLHDQVELDIPTAFSTLDFGLSCTTSAGATITGLIDYGQDLGAWAATGQSANAILYLMAKDVTPDRLQAFVVNGITWRVEAILAHDGHVYTLQVTTDRRTS